MNAQGAQDFGNELKERPPLRERRPVVSAQVDREEAKQKRDAHALEEIEARMRAAERVARPAAEMKDALLTRMELLLSEGLADVYTKLSPEAKKEFVKEGEGLAQWFHAACAAEKIKAHEVLSRIEGWLRIIARGNQGSEYWLRQEAYVRARSMLLAIRSEHEGH